MTVIPGLSAELAAATNRLLATAVTLSDADVAAPSRLPGWTRGHVLTHLARNADSLIRLLTWARTGVVTPQYPSQEARDAEIEAGAARPAAEHVADLEDSTARLAQEIRSTPEQAWPAMVGGLRGPSHPAWYILVRRLREVEIHHVDLGSGYGPADWPEPFVVRELHDCLACWPRERSTIGGIRFEGGPERLALMARDLGDGPLVEGAPADVLAWLTGRSAGEGVKVVPQGPLPAPPPWMTRIAPAGLPAAPPEEYP
ncbi:maleylpyruvate isomerase family mycothiol-dependent enzyme [Thermoactinospora rubra]|uniref:maleylpyruvate isomerase family mycothiol-dependent enzyme n=1 Tax=Thermoactinospora rubra TaxID=1088767 RepID=UPI000A10ED00|nr:maleylpyruvate isomerase family mycothiol-dependent enzyme [Thermoactinospora rubra]